MTEAEFDALTGKEFALAVFMALSAKGLWVPGIPCPTRDEAKALLVNGVFECKHWSTRPVYEAHGAVLLRCRHCGIGRGVDGTWDIRKDQALQGESAA